MNMIIKKLLKARLKKGFFAKETTLVAQELLGKLLVLHHNNSLLIGMIVETESYRSDDPASHAFIGKTERNSAMFGPVGHAYVYMNHGVHYGFNIVARSKKYPAGGVLIRAVEPLEGIETMKNNRKLLITDKTKTLKNLTNGPGKLTQAFGINKKYNNLNLLQKIFYTQLLYKPFRRAQE